MNFRMTGTRAGAKVHQGTTTTTTSFKAMIDSPNISEILKTKGHTVWTVTPETTVFDAIQLMADKNIGALVVSDGNRVIGVVSERDYTRKVILQGKASRTTQVREIMPGHPITVTPNHTVQECMQIMTQHRVRHLPVLDGGKMAGLVSIGDLVNWIITTQYSTIEQLQTYISGVPG
jgi:signal-transduction protein with cAMP-binding, CBS, and nucleotidyltransferase domain